MHYLDYHEHKQHGTPDFPIEFYYIDEHSPKYHMPFHWHMELELIRVLTGCFTLFLDNEEIIALPGDIIFINEGVIHGGTPEKCIYECIVFDMNPLLMHTEVCKQYLRRISNQHIIIQKHFTKKDAALACAANHLFKTMKQNAPGWELISLGSLYEFFGIIFKKGYYLEASARQAHSLKKTTLIKPVLEYIETAYASPITLNDLSKIAGMTPKYFCRYFRTLIHKTPMDYLNYYRIECACLLFTANNISVTDAAFRCGFNDPSYFIKAFKKYKKMTPKQYSLLFQEN